MKNNDEIAKEITSMMFELFRRNLLKVASESWTEEEMIKLNLLVIETANRGNVMK